MFRYNMQTCKGEKDFRIQLETDNEKYYNHVLNACRDCLDGIVDGPDKDTKFVTYKYEVNIGGGCATGFVTVPEYCTDDEIRLTIMDDLYDVSYERVEE